MTRVAPAKTILITGGSSGLGRAIALGYAASGVRLFLSGRNSERLAAVVAECQAKGAEAEGGILDVTDATAVREWITACDGKSPLDLVFANAGISAGTGGTESRIESGEQSAKVFATNVDGVRYTVETAVRLMEPRGHGQIAIISSLAGFRGLPGSAAYSGSKAAVRVWGEAVRGALAGSGVRLSVICPGYVATPMTDRNSYKMPFLLRPEQAVGFIQRGLARNKARIGFPRRLYYVVWFLATLPPAWTDRFFSRLPKKDVLPD